MKTWVSFAAILLLMLTTLSGCFWKSDLTGIYKGQLNGSDTNLAIHQKAGDISMPMELMLAQTDKNISGKITISKSSGFKKCI